MRHQHYHNCPIMDEPIPGEHIFTDHSREGSFNSCKACNPDKYKTVGQALTDLNNQRKQPRDSQRSKVYAAERSVTIWDEAKFKTLDELKVWLNDIIARAWFKRRWPYFRKLEVRDGRGRRSACGWGVGAVVPHAGIIKMPLWARTRLVALHELAHCLTPSTMAVHGREYCKVYVELVQFAMGKEESDALKKAFRAHRAKYSTPRKDKK